MARQTCQLQYTQENVFGRGINMVKLKTTGTAVIADLTVMGNITNVDRI